MTNSNNKLDDALIDHSLKIWIFILFVVVPLGLVGDRITSGYYLFLLMPIVIGLVYYCVVFNRSDGSYLSKWYWKCSFILEGFVLSVACFAQWAVDSKTNESLLWFVAFAGFAIINIAADYGYRTLNELEE
ncbi:hypothetical protein ABC502_03020 [Alkalimonas sp. NCh-2]|uniref:hypothetical protein n=1 Tax=Alkalimonas sp. NCh-2 TaxID=3144846 RepID=UPI0031F70170